jgi:hypothetical protein
MIDMAKASVTTTLDRSSNDSGEAPGLPVFTVESEICVRPLIGGHKQSLDPDIFVMAR